MSGPCSVWIERDARGRRVRERDRHGAAVATLDWAADGRLAGAAVRIPDGSWLRVAPRAATRATSAVTTQKAFRRGFSASMRARSASVISTAESCLSRMSAAISRAERQARSS